MEEVRSSILLSSTVTSAEHAAGRNSASEPATANTDPFAMRLSVGYGSCVLSFSSWSAGGRKIPMTRRSCTRSTHAISRGPVREATVYRIPTM